MVGENGRPLKKGFGKSTFMERFFGRVDAEIEKLEKDPTVGLMITWKHCHWRFSF